MEPQEEVGGQGIGGHAEWKGRGCVDRRKEVNKRESTGGHEMKETLEGIINRVCLKSVRLPDSRNQRSLDGGFESRISRIFVLGYIFENRH